MMLFPSKVARELIIRNGNHGQRGKLAAKLYEELDEAITARGALADRIRRCAQNGMIAMVESGRDCDGVQYSGKVKLVPATMAAYVEEYNRTAEWADGPFCFTVMSPSEALRVQYTSRDLVMEAFEDGHPHVIYSKF